MTLPGTLTGTPAFPASTGAPEAMLADALVRALPGPALMAQRHAGGPVPPEHLTGVVAATYVGAKSADLALVLLDRSELAAAGGIAGARMADVLRPAFEQAAAMIGGGMLGEIVEGSGGHVFASGDAAVFDLVGEAGIAGWFAVQQRRSAQTTPAFGGDVAQRLGRINNVEMTLTVEIGRARLSVRELLGAQPGTVIELDRAVGSEADVFLNGRLIAHGEIVVVDQQFAVRVTQVLDSVDEN